ncbi:cyclic AMP-responsive element-binding protein 3-like protein 4 [Acipenser ruthenus]|uniref:cyclic AMP-responsive element-binding protein 3-like protein 4 n=1 Tax=Acipenser ruthenus TaxID=7906 RepID=UPI00274122C9|nr:cyclic AMP-responsive element-binding protein 3-like protein 4 [Acipenser ruthenus]
MLSSKKMPYTQDFPEMESTDLLGLLFNDGNADNDDVFADGAMLMEEWGLSEQDMLNGIETEDFLNSILGSLEDEPATLQSWSPQGSDSGISDDNNNWNSSSSSDITPSPSPKFCEQPVNSPEFQTNTEVIQTDHNYSLNQDQQSTSDTLQSVRTEHPETDVSIDLDDWESQYMVEDYSSETPVSLAMEDFSQSDKECQIQFQFKELVLTEEEKRIMGKEGISIPTNLPLTKGEERMLKRIRRKIRNKQSAQESRKKKKHYVDGLESRVAACTVQNQELQKKVNQLQKQNLSLIEQLRKLQTLVKQTTMKSTTSSTCIMVFLLSFCLIVFPSVNPFGTSGSQKELYTPSGVISRSLRSLSGVETIKDEPATTHSLDATEKDLLLNVEITKSVLSEGLNRTPEVQKVEKAESESAVNSNSSSDLPSQAKTKLSPAGERHLSPGNEAVDYTMTAAAVNKEDWLDQKTTTVIIQQHRSDEM